MLRAGGQDFRALAEARFTVGKHGDPPRGREGWAIGDTEAGEEREQDRQGSSLV